MSKNIFLPKKLGTREFLHNIQEKNHIDNLNQLSDFIFNNKENFTDGYFINNATIINWLDQNFLYTGFNDLPYDFTDTNFENCKYYGSASYHYEYENLTEIFTSHCYKFNGETSFYFEIIFFDYLLKEIFSKKYKYNYLLLLSKEDIK